MELTLNESALRDLGSVLGLGEEYDADALIEKVKGAVADKAPAPEGRALSEDEYATLLADARAGKEAREELRVMTRDRLIDSAIEAGKIDPAKREEFVTKYDEAPEAVAWAIDQMAVNADLKVYGSDDGKLDDATREADEAMFTAMADRLGIPNEERA